MIDIVDLLKFCLVGHISITMHTFQHLLEYVSGNMLIPAIFSREETGISWSFLAVPDPSSVSLRQ